MDAVHEMLGFIFFKKEKAEKRVDNYFWLYDQDIESKQKGIFFPIPNRARTSSSELKQQQRKFRIDVG